jgi:hypothetical protein
MANVIGAQDERVSGYNFNRRGQKASEALDSLAKRSTFDCAKMSQKSTKVCVRCSLVAQYGSDVL